MKQILFSGLILFLFTMSGFSQVNAIPFNQSMDTFQVINGTVVDLPGEDDIFHANLPVGFSFIHNGNTVSKFGICTNGFITLDSLNHSPMWFLNANSTNQICVFQSDLRNTNAGGSIEYITIGVAPNRILIVQWKDYGIFGIPFCHLNFQIRIHENSSCIQLYYGYNALAGNTGKYFGVGLTGTNTIDYNLRETALNWVNSSPSLSFPGALMFLNPLATLPSGLVYSFGTCPPTGIPFAYLSGKVYNDVNGNGIQDIGDNGIPNIIVQETLENHYTTTDSMGNYGLFFTDSNLTYSIHAVSPLYWNISSIPLIHTVTPATQAVNGRDFGLHATPNVHDVGISSFSTAAVPNANITFFTTYHNYGTVIEPGDSIFLVKDSHYNFISGTPAPSYVNGDSIIWTYANLLLSESRTINVSLHADTTINIGDTLHSFWSIKPISGDAAPQNNMFALHQPVQAAFDPNAKSVLPDGNIVNTQELFYTIHFQNTGTASAQNVFLFDTLDPNLDVSTFKLTGFSHPLSYSISGSGNLAFTFANINLPDSNTNEPGSHGMVSFTLRPKPGLAQGTLLHNTASIVFDYNTAIITNTTQNIIMQEIPSTTGEVSNTTSSLIVYPNPAGDFVNIWTEDGFHNARITLMDIHGKQILQQFGNGAKSMRMDVACLSKGVYLIEVVNAGLSKRFKLTKQ